MIGIVDYGLGNISAFLNIYKYLDKDIIKLTEPKHFNEVEKIILPGVGSFDWALDKLFSSGLKEPLENAVLDKKKQILGICVGMQIMASSSEEGQKKGLNWIKGRVIKFKNSNNTSYPLPQIGWNDVIMSNNPLLKGMESSKFYFLHSYHYCPENVMHSISKTTYIREFTSAINRENIYGVQFHPEKSHSNGIKLLKNFADL